MEPSGAISGGTGGTAGGIALTAIIIGVLVFLQRKRVKKSAQIEPYPVPGLHTPTFRHSGNVDLKPSFQHNAASFAIVAAADAPSTAPSSLEHLNQENSVGESSSLLINSVANVQTFRWPLTYGLSIRNICKGAGCFTSFSANSVSPWQ